jgi:hypothetical protein
MFGHGNASSSGHVQRCMEHHAPESSTSNRGAGARRAASALRLHFMGTRRDEGRLRRAQDTRAVTCDILPRQARQRAGAGSNPTRRRRTLVA